MAAAESIQAIEAPPKEGLKETFESIIVALILAFVFRAFIVEAFVIPTGSMAPTLYGAHGTVVCEDCGIEFAYGLRDLSDPHRGISPVRATSRAECPNCNHVNTNLRISDDQRNPEKGDRILVLKWPYDFGVSRLEPHRWDVIVFKDPSDAKTNFIKRLVGVPGEVLMILDGDVYTVPAAELSPGAVGALQAQLHDKYIFRSGQRSTGRLLPIAHEYLTEIDSKARIARKTNVAQESLWFPVYDHDFPPQTPDATQPRWAPVAGSESGWNASEPIITFTDRAVDHDYIELRGKRIEADYAYNIQHNGNTPPVSDLRAEFVLTPASTNGRIDVRLDKLGRTFWATVDFDGTVSLSESDTLPTRLTPAMAARELPSLRPGKPVQIAFENVDYRLALYVDGHQVLASSDDPDSPAYYGPDMDLLRRLRSGGPVTPRIYAEGGELAVTHLVVYRDVYYYHASRHGRMKESWMPDQGWASPYFPILLRDEEYFMLGDNTAASKDSRLWDEAATVLTARGQDFQLGTVPRDQLIGQAFFVYWPSGHSVRWLPRMGTWNWPIIPDVGRMRWIR